MKHTRFALTTLCLGLSLAGAPLASAGAKGEATQPAQAAPAAPDDAMMAEMMKAAAPTAEHKGLEAMVGTWHATVKLFAGPGEPMVSAGTMVNAMQFGGRCLEGRYAGTMMGAPMEGLSLMGFDTQKKEYWAFWTDNLSTSSMMQTGPASADRKAIRVKGVAAGPDGKAMEYVSTTKMVDADTHVYTMDTSMDGKLVPWMEITYKRAP
jgi:hypothetical protein